MNVVNINGKITKAEDAKISVLDHGLLYGDGIYDTLRIYKGRALYLQEHINRLYNSAKGITLKIPMEKNCLINEIAVTYKKSEIENAFIRVIITRGSGQMGLSTKCVSTVIIMVIERLDYEEPVSITISSITKIPSSSVNSKLKTLNYINNMLAKIDAKSRGFDEAIMLNQEGNISEASTSNIFFVKNGNLFTPMSDDDILEGVTRKAIIENFSVIETHIHKSAIYSDDEIFLSGTVAGIVPVIKVDDRKLRVGPVTQKLIEWYEKVKLRGEWI